MDHLHLWGRGWSSCHPPQAWFPHRNRAGHTCRCSAVSPERLWVFTVTHEPYLWPPHQWRHTDGVTQAKRVFPLFPFRGFSGTPPACWLSVFKKRKEKKLILGRIQPPSPHPVHSQRPLVQGSTWLNCKHFGVSMDILIITLCFTLRVKRDAVLISLHSPCPF